MSTGERSEHWIDRSSLGTPAAKALRERTSKARAKEIRELQRLTAAVEAGEWWELGALAQVYERAGNLDAAERALRELAARSLGRLAKVRDQVGDPKDAEQWRARSRTL